MRAPSRGSVSHVLTIAGILAFFAALFVIVLIHEMGHLLAAKWAGMPASVFSVGFGKRLWGFHWRGTEYRLSLIPLGGYVRIDPMEQTVDGVHGPTTRFDTYPWYKRAVVISAGVAMNLVLALGIYVAVPSVFGVTPPAEARISEVASEQPSEVVQAWSQLPADVRVVSFAGRDVRDMQDLLLGVAGAAPGLQKTVFEDGSTMELPVPADEATKMALVAALRPSHEPIVGTVVPGTPAEEAGFQPLDRIVSANGAAVPSWESWQRLVESSAGVALPVSVLRAGRSVDLALVPRAQTGDDGETVGAAGLGRGVLRERVGAGKSFRHAVGSFGRTVEIVKESWMILLRGRISVRQISGPITVVETTVRVFRNGWEPFLAFVAFLSVNIAIVNMLPIPALDGGYLTLLGVEVLRRRPLSAPVQAYLGRVGLIWLCLVMAGTVVNDLLRLAAQ
jgi:regulator of sigma E protease